MRRPVKPFVTEYRGGTRRQGAGGQAPKPDFSNINPDPPAAEQRSAVTNLADPQEDTYEAALRAADALFSTRQRTAAPTLRQQSDASADGSTASAQAAPSGRVLRVLDEPPSPELLRLEAERAPKRRGRKPGSKNKPKPIPPIVAQEAVAVPPDAPATETAAPAPMLAVAVRLAALPRAPARGPAVAATQAGDKYAWVRTKLKPGQQWKRRLPKVAW